MSLATSKGVLVILYATDHFHVMVLPHYIADIKILAWPVYILDNNKNFQFKKRE